MNGIPYANLNGIEKGVNMSRQPEQLRQYWLGYRACDVHIYEFGFQSASEKYTYCLSGRPYAYCKGWFARLNKSRDRVGR